MKLHLMMDALVLQNLINKHTYMHINIYTKIRIYASSSLRAINRDEVAGIIANNCHNYLGNAL